MATIITGTFEQQAPAKRALSELADAGFSADLLTSFFVSAPASKPGVTGRGEDHAGDSDESPGSGAASGATVGGAVGVAVGVATVPLLGPAAAFAGAGIGAYVGSLVGALNALGDEEAQDAPESKTNGSRADGARTSGTLVGISASGETQQGTAIRILRANGAMDVERAEGNLVAGEWTDFDVSAPLRLVA